jgi:hypothetical protein
MRVEGRGDRRVVSQILLEKAQVHPRLEQMGRPGVAKGMNRSALVDAACLESRPAGILHTGSGPGLRGGGHTRACPAWSWEDPDRVAMGAPVGT